MLRRHHKEDSAAAPARGKFQATGPVKVTGTVLESPDAAPGATGPAFLAMAASHDYVIEIAAPDGTLIHATVSAFSRIVHQVGAPFHVEIEPRTGIVSVDHHAMSLVATQLMKEHAAEIPGSQAQADARRGAPGTFDPIPGPGRPGGIREPAMPSFGGSGTLGGGAGTLGGGTGTLGGGAGSFGGDGSFGFDDPTAGFDVASSGPGLSGDAPTFQSGPAGTGGFGGPDAFDFGPGAGTTEQKLAHLKQLLDKGILTESEYHAQVQQVRSGG